MKNIVIVFCILFSSIAQAQLINWRSLVPERNHIVNANFGIDYGVTYGVGYGYQIKSKLPLIANVEFSLPSGKTLADDYKTKIGGQIRLLNYHNLVLSAKIQGVFRRYEGGFVRLVNFGSDISGSLGYYRAKWFVVGEFGFDKAIVTQFKHSSEYKSQYPQVVDGWYEPSTGGNFYFGAQTGLSFKQFDVYLKAGRTVAQDFEMSPLIPFYTQVGCNYKF